MFCSNCSKLTMLMTHKNCMRCQGQVYNNLSVLCDQCSSNEQMCSICLKKMQNSTVSKYKNSGCGACRR